MLKPLISQSKSFFLYSCNTLCSITISIDVNHSVDAEAFSTAQSSEDVELKSKPSFEVDVKKGDTTLSFTCSFLSPEEGEEPRDADVAMGEGPITPHYYYYYFFIFFEGLYYYYFFLRDSLLHSLLLILLLSFIIIYIFFFFEGLYFPEIGMINRVVTHSHFFFFDRIPRLLLTCGRFRRCSTPTHMNLLQKIYSHKIYRLLFFF